MPYIKSKIRRRELDKIVELMINNRIKANGDLNYVLFKFCKKHVGKSYNSIKNFIGELNETIAEIKRRKKKSEFIKELKNTIKEIRKRILGPYEDKKKEENGDVF